MQHNQKKFRVNNASDVSFPHPTFISSVPTYGPAYPQFYSHIELFSPFWCYNSPYSFEESSSCENPSQKCYNKVLYGMYEQISDSCHLQVKTQNEVELKMCFFKGSYNCKFFTHTL